MKARQAAPQSYWLCCLTITESAKIRLSDRQSRNCRLGANRSNVCDH
ncbi:hypothetical protein [Chlorogloeopsis fritschii]|nr:hypothetical protein [Chlorogloeopsis fritschii]